MQELEEGYHNLKQPRRDIVTGQGLRTTGWNRKKEKSKTSRTLTTPARPDPKTKSRTQPWAGRRAL